MDQNQLSKFFPRIRSLDVDSERAIEDLYTGARDFADLLQKLLPESNQKMDLLMRLFYITRDAEMALRLDGPSRMTPIIVTKQ